MLGGCGRDPSAGRITVLNSARTLPGRLVDMARKVEGAYFKTVGIKRLNIPSLTLCKLDTLPSGYLCSIFML